jgi:hypothetical protein
MMRALPVHLRARLVRRIREELASLDGLPDTYVPVIVGSDDVAEQVKLDLTLLEQERVVISCLPETSPRPCEVCELLLTASCAHCVGPACVSCDRCHGCQQLVCRSCDSAGATPFSFPGDTYLHPHSPEAT